MLSSVKPVLRLRVLPDRDDVLRRGMLPRRDGLPERRVCAGFIEYSAESLQTPGIAPASSPLIYTGGQTAPANTLPLLLK
ncbi:MAG: hypothetical protein MZV70_44255 [Desulfobacterales bacterium]|nr:hypothetical protein [Desulfobacterales bacterium]